MKHSVCDLEVRRTVEVVYTGGTVELSTDGSTLYSMCSNVVKVIKLDDEHMNYVIGDPEESLRITCICLDNNRCRLIIAYNNQVIREYRLTNNGTDLARTYKTLHTAPILCMSVNGDSSWLATGSADHNVKVWDLVQQHCIHTFKGIGVVSTISFIQNNRFMVGYMEGEVRMFDLARSAVQKMIREWKVHSSRITGFVELSEAQRVIAVSRDQTASIIEIETGEIFKVFPLFEAIEAAALAHNGNLVTVGEEGTVKEWLIHSGRLLRSEKISRARLDSLKYNSNCNQLLITSDEQTIFLVHFENISVRKQIVGFHDEIYSCSLLGKDNSHLAVASNTKEIRLYDTKTWDCRLIEGHKESVLCIATASFDRCLVATSCKDGSIILWKLDKTADKMVQIAYATGHTNSVNAVCFSHSGKRPFLVSVSLDTTIKLWSLVNLTALIDSNIHGTELQKLICSSTLVAHSKDVTSVDVSISNSVTITGSLDKLVKLWHIDDGKMRLGIAGTLSGHRRGVSDVRLSPNSLKAASSSGDMTIKVWSLSDKTCLQTLSGHNSAVFRILFVNRSSQIISADSAGIIKIWTLATSEADRSIEAHTDKIWTLLVNNDESEYISAGADGRIIVWKDVSEDRKMEAEARARKHLEEEQTLSNFLEQERLQEALEYALGLVRPFCTLKVIERLHDSDELVSALMKLNDQHIQTLLDFVTQWNTSSKTSLTSQIVLNCLLKMLPPEKFLAFSNIKSIVESLIPYTRRHMERLNKARQDVSLLKFTWSQMRLN